MREFAFLALVGVLAVAAWRYEADGESTVADGATTESANEPRNRARFGPATADSERRAGRADGRNEGGPPGMGATDDVDALDLSAPFVVRWVDPDRRTVRVADGEYSAVFDVVDRGGDVVVEPADGAFRRGDAPEDWYARAAAALEDALPDRVDAFADAAAGWVDDEDRLTADDVVDAFDCEHVRDIGRGRVVVAEHLGKRAELVVDHGSATFTSPVDRNRYPDAWARRALLAAEVFVQRQLVDGNASATEGNRTGDDPEGGA